MIIASLLLPFYIQAQLLSPQDFFYHTYGESFTEHHDLLQYVYHLAENSQYMHVEEYGRSVQGRPLIVAYFSTSDKLNNLEQVRQNHLKSLGFEDEEPAQPDIPIVWLSFGVHGNEPGATESSIEVMYHLANPKDKETMLWLQNILVIIDPCLNPDGYNRYTTWFNNQLGRFPNVNSLAREHREPWPGGRSNHYMFDLNRDWSWQTQQESRQRMQHYYKWLPHIHGDYHEQFINDPYFFSPMAAPVHEAFAAWQIQVQYEIGMQNAHVFDANGWSYFTGDYFDYFYPGYGDSYPGLNGAVGITYEQAGHSRAGIVIITETGDTLSLKDRIKHHKATSLTNIAYANRSADFLTQAQIKHFEDARNNPPGPWKNYLVRTQYAPGRAAELIQFLDNVGIVYHWAKPDAQIQAMPYLGKSSEQLRTIEGDLVIHSAQSFASKVWALFEPEPFLSDTATYDITAWALPFAYNLPAWTTNQNIPVYDHNSFSDFKEEIPVFPDAYAYAFRKESVRDTRFMAYLMQSGIRLRYFSEPITISDMHFHRGTIVAMKADNRRFENFGQYILEAAALDNIPVYTLESGFSTNGPDLGSDKVRYIKPPSIALFSGPQTAATSVGEIWHLFDHGFEYPITILEHSEVSGINLQGFDVLILPEGRYPIDANSRERLAGWVQQGGKLIVVGSSNSKLEGNEGFLIQRFATDKDRQTAEMRMEQHRLDNRLSPYTGQMRSMISHQISGAVIELSLDGSHPLAFGLGDTYYTLKTDSRFYNHLQGVWNVAFTEQAPLTAGFIGAEVRDFVGNNTHFGVQNLGGGTVVYLTDNPLFRGFWEAGKALFGNAVFLVGN